jgi:hypothetical protein
VREKTALEVIWRWTMIRRYGNLSRLTLAELTELHEAYREAIKVRRAA